MQIAVIVDSINGKIEAGFCTIDVSRQLNNSIIPLKKCSDKSATICLSSNYKFIKTIKQTQFNDNSRLSGKVINVSHHHRGLKKMKSFDLGRNQLDLSESYIIVDRSSTNKLEQYFKQENQELLKQIQKLRQKITLNQHQNKGLSKQIKDYTQRNERMNIKLAQLQIINANNQKIILQKDKNIKLIDIQLQKTKQTRQNDIQSRKIQVKRYELKEESLKEQVGRLNDRIMRCQAENKQISNNYNTLLYSYSQIQKNKLNSSYEKDKMWIIQKNRFIKDINQKDQQNQKLVEINLQLKNQVLQHKNGHFQENNQHFHSKLSSKQREIQDLQSQIFDLKKQLNDKGQQLDQLQKNDDSRQVLRKKYQQAIFENNQLKIDVQKYKFTSSSQEVKLAQMGQKIEECEKDKKKSSKKISQMVIQLQQKFHELLSIQKLLQNSHNKYQQLNNRCQNLKNQKEKLQQIIKQLQNRKNRQIYQCKRQIKSLSQKITYDQQILDRFEHNIAEKQKLNSDLKIQNYQINCQIIINEQRNRKNQRQIEDYINKIEELNQILKHYENNNAKKQEKQEKDYILELHKKNEQMNTKINALELQIQQYRLQRQQLIKINQQQIDLHESKEKQWQNQHFGFKSKINQYEIDFQNASKRIQNLTFNLKQIKIEFSFIQAENYQLKRNLIEKDNEGDKNNEWKNKLLKEIQEIKVKDEIIQQKIKEKTEIFNYEMKQYKAIIKWMITVISREDQIPDAQFKLFEQNQLKQLLLEALNKRNAFLKDFKYKHEQSIEQKQFLEFQLQKIGQQSFDSVAQYEQTIQKQRNDRYIAQKQLFVQRNFYFSEYQRLQQLYDQLKISKQVQIKSKKIIQNQQEQMTIQLQKIKCQYNRALQMIQKYQKQNTQCLHEINELKLNRYKESILQIEIEQKDRQFKEQISSISLNSRKNIQGKQFQIQSKQEKIKQLEENNIILEGKIKRLQYTHNVHTDVQKQYKNQIQQLSKQKIQLGKIKNELQSQLFSKIQQIKHKEQYQHELLIKNKQQKMQKDELSEEIQQSKKRMEDLKKENHDKQEMIDKKHQTIKQAERSNAQLKMLVLQKEYMINKYVMQVQIKDIMIKTLQEKAQSFQQQNKRLLNETITRRQALFRMQSDHQMIHKEILFEQSHKNTIEREFQEININYEHAKQQIYNLQEEKSKLMEQLTLLKYKLTEQEQKLLVIIQKNNVSIEKYEEEHRKIIKSFEEEINKVNYRYQEQLAKNIELGKQLQKKEFQKMAFEQEEEKTKFQYESIVEALNIKIERLEDRMEELCLEHEEEKNHLNKQIQTVNNECHEFGLLIYQKEKEIQNIKRTYEQMQQAQIDQKSLQNSRKKLLQTYKEKLKQEQVKENEQKK